MARVSKSPGEFSRRSFFLFILMAPAGLAIILAIILVTQYRQFKASVSPAPDVQEFAWDSLSLSRVDTVLADLHSFSSNPIKKFDSLWIDSRDLNLLMAHSSVIASQGIRFHAEMHDSLIVIRSTQAVQSMQGKFAGIFKKIAHSTGYLNARLEGEPELKDGRLDFAPDSGFLNGQKVVSVALQKRGGMSPGDFTTDTAAYGEFVRALGEVKVMDGRILLVRHY